MTLRAAHAQRIDNEQDPSHAGLITPPTAPRKPVSIKRLDRSEQARGERAS